MSTQELIHGELRTDNVLENNEIQANKLVGFMMFLGSLFMLGNWVLSKFRILYIDLDRLIVAVLLELLIPALLCRIYRARAKWLKYVLLTEVVFVIAHLDCFLSYHVVLIMAIPVVLSCRYYSRRFTHYIADLTAVVFAVSAFVGAYWDFSYLDLNYYNLPGGTDLVVSDTLEKAVRAAGIDPLQRALTYLLQNYSPKLFVFILLTLICLRIAQRGRDMVEEQSRIAAKNTRIQTELSLARNIQGHMLPTDFPPHEGCREISMYAIMDPAIDVGGDFYDFFMTDDTHLAVVIADVSGKGIPASLFMVIAKAFIKTEASSGHTPAEVFTKVNHMLCDGNDNNMFVTAWMGILDLTSGILTYVNAGHTPPLLYTDDGWNYLESKPGFVLAGMDGMQYRQYELPLQPGDRLFLYTDGITEAANAAEDFYGSERLLAYLNTHTDFELQELLCTLRKDIADFAEDAEQFDDITMLALRVDSLR